MLTFITVLISFVHYLEKIISFCVLVRVILSWFPLLRMNFFTRLVTDVTQPLFLLVYKVFPSMRQNGIDLSPIIVFIGIQIVRDLVIHSLATFL